MKVSMLRLPLVAVWSGMLLWQLGPLVSAGAPKCETQAAIQSCAMTMTMCGKQSGACGQQKEIVNKDGFWGCKDNPGEESKKYRLALSNESALCYILFGCSIQGFEQECLPNLLDFKNYYDVIYKNYVCGKEEEWTKPPEKK